MRLGIHVHRTTGSIHTWYVYTINFFVVWFIRFYARCSSLRKGASHTTRDLCISYDSRTCNAHAQYMDTYISMWYFAHACTLHSLFFIVLFVVHILQDPRERCPHVCTCMHILYDTWYYVVHTFPYTTHL